VDRNELLDRLKALLDAEFEELVFHVDVERSILPGGGAPQLTRAIELIRWAEARDQLEALEQAYWRVTQGALSDALASGEPGSLGVPHRPSSFVDHPSMDAAFALARKYLGARTDAVRDKANRGETVAAREELEALVNEAGPAIGQDPTMEARVLRLRAGLALDGTEKDVSGARTWLSEAARLDPDEKEVRYFEAMLIRESDGPQAAFEALKGAPRASRIQNLRAGLLLELDRPDDASDVLSDVTPPNHDTHRLRALIALRRQDSGAAREAIDEALALKPEVEFVRFTAALVAYREALLPGASFDELLWPHPSHATFASADATRLDHLKRATELFAGLAQSHGHDRPLYRLWQVACWCLRARVEPSSSVSAKAEASAIAAASIDDDPGSPGFVFWATTFNLDVDFDKAITRLKARQLSDSVLSATDAEALMWLYLHVGTPAAAESALKALETEPSEESEAIRWLRWRVRLLVQAERPGTRWKLSRRARRRRRYPTNGPWCWSLWHGGTAIGSRCSRFCSQPGRPTTTPTFSGVGYS